MIKNKVISDLNDHLFAMSALVIEAEEVDSDFTIIRELIEQVMSEMEVLDE